MKDVPLLEADSNPKGSGRRKRVSARHQVKRLDRPFERVRSSKNGPAEETGFLRSVRISDPQFHRGPKPSVKSGPDVFADALVPRIAGGLSFQAVEPGAPAFLHPQKYPMPFPASPGVRRPFAAEAGPRLRRMVIGCRNGRVNRIRRSSGNARQTGASVIPR